MKWKRNDRGEQNGEKGGCMLSYPANWGYEDDLIKVYYIPDDVHANTFYDLIN